MNIDMSPEAVSIRLKRASQLRALCLALAGPRLKRPWGVPAPSASPAVKEQSSTDKPTSGNVLNPESNLKPM